MTASRSPEPVSSLRQRPPIRRFLLLSLLLHALLVTLPAMFSNQPLPWPAPELSVTFRGISPATVAPAAMAVASAERDDSPAPVRTAPVAAAQSPAPSASPAETGPDDDRPAPDPRLTNHLQSLLRTALQAHFVYPALARRQGWQGRVHMALHIEADGRLSELQVLRSSGYAVLDTDAVQTLQRIGQLPQARAWLSGRARRVEIPVVYRLLEG